MKKEERIKKIVESFENALKNREDFITVKHPGTGKFVQFAVFQQKNIIIMDVPLLELSDEELTKIKGMLNAEVGMERSSNEPISVQRVFGYDEIRDAPEVVEEIFLKIFGMPIDYDIAVEVFPR
jgi:hypothetical protein